MATILMMLLVVGYALSVWSLKRQEHFGEPHPSRHRRRRFGVLGRHVAPLRTGAR